MTFPTTFILFGITGDLAQKKILPALYSLYEQGKIDSKTRIVGFSRRDIPTSEIKDFVRSTIHRADFDPSFLDIVSYVQGNFDEQKSYQRLADHLAGLDEAQGSCSNKLFYLSVPPNLYEMIVENISVSGLSISCGGADGFARILIEKPFGNDLVTAQKLDLLLGKLFKEEQIFRIDHYVAKDSLFKIIDLHRKEELLEKRWNKDYVDRVEINLFETATVGSRGASYDGVGAFRDVGQNHMLQMLALIAMDMPTEQTACEIQKARAKVLQSIVSSPASGIVRGQYEGYLSEPGVAPNSNTETFFQITVHLNSDKFACVPFVLTSGKALAENKTEISIYFKDGKKLVFEVPPQDSQPAYEKILLDCISGDQTVFISTEEIMAEWAFVTPIIEKWKDIAPFVYAKGSDPKSVVKK